MIREIWSLLLTLTVLQLCLLFLPLHGAYAFLPTIEAAAAAEKKEMQLHNNKKMQQQNNHQQEEDNNHQEEGGRYHFQLDDEDTIQRGKGENLLKQRAFVEAYKNGNLSNVRHKKGTTIPIVIYSVVTGWSSSSYKS